MMASRQMLGEAVQALYYHQDPDVKRQANAWLEEFQGSTDAWQICVTVLGDPASDPSLRYFCAQTLRTKCARDFEELPAGAGLAVRDSLVGLMLAVGTGPANVRMQLCLAVAALATHIPAREWMPATQAVLSPNVPNVGVLPWLAARFGAAPPEAALACMLEMLAVLPQEASAAADNRLPQVRPERRRAFVAEVSGATQPALALLASCLAAATSTSAPAGAVTEAALQAYAAWLRLVSGRGPDGDGESGPSADPTAPSPADLAANPLTAHTLSALESGDGFEAAVEVACELLRASAPVRRGESLSTASMPLVALLVPRLMALRRHFVLAATPGPDEDPDRAKGLARLFAECGEAYVGTIAKGEDPAALEPVHALLEVVAAPDDGLAATSFNFWQALAAALGAPLDDDNATETSRRLALFAPAFGALVTRIRGRVAYPLEFVHWGRDDRADFKRSRYAVADTLLDACGVLGFGSVLALLAEPLRDLATACAAGAPFEWRTAEAALYCIRSIQRHAPRPTCDALGGIGHRRRAYGDDSQASSSETLLLQLLAMLRTLPAQPQLTYTAVLVAAAYADWLAAHLAAHDPVSPHAAAAAALLPELLQLPTGALREPEAAAAGAHALREMCDACGRHLGPHLPGLLALGRSLLGGASGVEEEDVLLVIEALAIAAAAQVPPGAAAAALEELVAPLVGGLQALLQPSGIGGGPAGAPPPAPPLSDRALLVALAASGDRLASVFKVITAQPAAAAAALARLWPLLERALSLAEGDERHTEKLCRTVKHALRAAGRAAAPLLPALAGTLATRFRSHRAASYLYVAAETVRAFGPVATCAPVLSALLVALVGDATAVLCAPSAFDAAPDVADDTFLLAAKCIALCPSLLVGARLVGPLLDSAMAGMLVQHREACQSVLSFLTQLLRLPGDARTAAALQDPAGGADELNPEQAAALAAEVPPRGPLLTQLLLAAAAGGLPTSRLDDIAQVLEALLQLAGPTAVQWVATALTGLPVGLISAAEKDAFIRAVAAAAEVSHAGHRTTGLLCALDDFGDVCRRSRRVREAAIAALLPPGRG